ncbi:MAG: hypothetical protein WCP95_15555 [Actinomycetes bacterium]
MSEDPIWLDWVEPEVTDLAGEQLHAFVDQWHREAQRYRRERQRVSAGHSDAYRFAYSAWWCSKRESMGLREQQRRRIIRERDAVGGVGE